MRLLSSAAVAALVLASVASAAELEEKRLSVTDFQGLATQVRSMVSDDGLSCPATHHAMAREGFKVNGVPVRCGNKIAPNVLQDLPADGSAFSWESAAPQDYYTIAIIDPDAGDSAPVRHFVAMNLRGATLHGGYGFNTADVVSELYPFQPEEEVAHRYVFLVWKQPGLIANPETLPSAKIGDVAKVRGGAGAASHPETRCLTRRHPPAFPVGLRRLGQELRD